MADFQRIHASSPSKLHQLATAHAALADVSRSSTISVPELAGLTPNDVDLLDEVIQRASPSATTFLHIFKAYNDILQERGIDPHEVLYYGKLLKLGTLKGANWGEKWRMVKLKHGYGDVSNEKAVKGQDASEERPVLSTTRRGFSTLPSGRHNVLQQLHADDSIDPERTRSDGETDNSQDDSFQYGISCRPRSPLTSVVKRNNSLGLDVEPQDHSRPPARYTSLLSKLRQPKALEDCDGASDPLEGTVGAPSTTPPSYRAAMREESLNKARNTTLLTKPDRSLFSKENVSSEAARQAVAQARERRGSIINEDEAWNKIKMSQDEKEADRFRDDRLLERCWDAWKEELQWIIKTNEQIAQARDSLIMRLSFQRWRSFTTSRAELNERMAALANKRILKAALGRWKTKHKEKRQSEWRQGMRSKMKIVREKREDKLRKDAWAKWRQSHQSHLSSQHHSERLILRFYGRWKAALACIDHLESHADEFMNETQWRDARRCWNHWKRALDLRAAERIISERVNIRISRSVMFDWLKRTQENHAADILRNTFLLQSALRSWKASRGRKRNLERRADKHLARKDDVLLRAIARVWKARERGRLLERVKIARLVKHAWALWRGHLRENRERQDLALAFSLRPESSVASSALQRWCRIYATHQNASSFAVQYHSAQLCFKSVLVWRIHLRSKLKMIKNARIAEKFFVTRRNWRQWILKLEERQRETKLKLLTTRRVQKSFNAWFHRAQRRRLIRLAEQTVEDRLAKRVLRDSLARWTNRVIEAKLKEFEVARRYRVSILMLAFKKWKSARVRHVEELSLMESYQYVKMEENIRRFFHRWLSVARASRYRRVVLQQKEDELRRENMAMAWDQWRERFIDRKLFPIESELLLQTQRNILYRAFGLWHSKTHSLPAIRFYASHTKAKYWEIWRSAMPRALQAKEAREMDRRLLSSKFLEKWAQTYKTKIALKAVARARYLRLPTAAPRQPTIALRTSRATVPQNVFRQKPTLPASENVEVGSSRPNVHKSPLAARGDLFPRPKARSEASPVRPHHSVYVSRDSSPSRSYTGGKGRLGGSRPVSPTGNDGRSQLWMELREIQWRSRPPTERSCSREPP